MTRDQIYAYGRNVVSGFAGALAAIGLMKAVDVATLLNSLDQINDAVGKIIAAVGLITPIVAGLFAKRSAAPEAQVQKALSADPTTVINHAILQQPVEAISAVAELKQVRLVVTDAATAQASTSNFVQPEITR